MSLSRRRRRRILVGMHLQNQKSDLEVSVPEEVHENNSVEDLSPVVDNHISEPELVVADHVEPVAEIETSLDLSESNVSTEEEVQVVHDPEGDISLVKKKGKRFGKE